MKRALWLTLAIGLLGCDEEPAKGVAPGSSASAHPAPSASVAVPQPDGGVKWQCVMPPETCHDEIIYPQEKALGLRCTFQEAHAREVLYGDKDKPSVALLCSCHGDSTPKPADSAQHK